MRIGELSRQTGISTSRIRFYEKHALLPKAIRAGNGYRAYPDTAVKSSVSSMVRNDWAFR
jgi:MerR family transcriptional regulator, copper efflux regulator